MTAEAAAPATPPAASLRRRITAVYTLYALCFVIFFAAVTAITVEGIEGHLVEARLHQAAIWALPRHAAGMPVDMPAGISFHYGRDIPRALLGLADGVHMLSVEGQGLHILAGTDHGSAYAVVDHESDYVKVEKVVYSMVGVCLAGFLAFSYFLAGHVARRVIDPLAALSDAVTSGAPLPRFKRPDELARLAAAFKGSTDALHRALERERYFAGDVSHELRTALAVILGAAEVMQSRPGPQAETGPVQRIHRTATEAGELVQVLLLLARAPSADGAAEVDLGDVVARELLRHGPLAARKGVRLHLAGGAPFAVRAQAELCAAAIGNLVRNACLYTEAGKVSVRFEARRVVIEDTGGGLPEAVLAAVENRAPAPSSGSAGTGLGLSLTRRICDYLGASLAYRPAPGGGSRFTIDFFPS